MDLPIPAKAALKKMLSRLKNIFLIGLFRLSPLPGPSIRSYASVRVPTKKRSARKSKGKSIGTMIATAPDFL